MKKKYSEILKESLISFDGMAKTSHTVNDILNYKGNGMLPTHKKANNVVSVLERMYHQEDGDLPVMKEGEETRVAQGMGPETKIHNDVKKTDVGTVATQATGVAHVSPQKKDELKKTISDTKTDDKTLATESSEDGSDDELSRDPDECTECVEENAIFEDGDADGAAEIEHEAAEGDHDPEAVGEDPRDGRAMKIGDGGTSLSNDETIGDDEIDGMEEESEGLPEENRMSKTANINEEYEDAEEPGEEAPETEEPGTEETDDEEMSKVPGEDDETEEETGDEKLEEEMNEEEMQEETDETGGDEEVEDGMDELPEDEEHGTEMPEGEEHGTEMPEGEEPSEELDEGEAQGIVGQNSEDEMSHIHEEEMTEEAEENPDHEVPPHDEEEETPEEEAEETPETQHAEEEAGTEPESHLLDVDKKAKVKESIISRENTEETIVERLIREMNLNADTSSELDEIEIEESFED